ncbi:hypothetical protein ACFX13_037907 [Malus domestica]
MVPVAHLPFFLADRNIQAIVDAYKDEPGNPKYAFKHLLFSVTDPQFRVKPAGVSERIEERLSALDVKLGSDAIENGESEGFNQPPTWMAFVDHPHGKARDVFAVKQACKSAKEHALKNGPIILEMDTYRRA